jgi:hypothetical protein
MHLVFPSAVWELIGLYAYNLFITFQNRLHVLYPIRHHTEPGCRFLNKGKRTRYNSLRWHTEWRTVFCLTFTATFVVLLVSVALGVLYKRKQSPCKDQWTKQEVWQSVPSRLRKSVGGQPSFSPNHLYLLYIRVQNGYSGKFFHSHVSPYFPGIWLRVAPSFPRLKVD